jgi:GDP-L-fucose synthase
VAKHVAAAVGFSGRIELDPTMPDGTPRKLLDISRMKLLGWSPKIGLERGLSETYADFLKGYRAV